jgi:molybdate transport system substrate-binding protein
MLRRALSLPAIAFVVALAALLAPSQGQGQDAPTSATVFAAASMKNALDDVIAAYGRNTGRKVVASYAASSALAKQIEEGAPADVFVSADQEWMDYIAQKKLIVAKSRFNLLGNRLVLIAPKDSKLGDVTIGPGFDIAKLAGDGRIAVGDVRAVPAGKYAKAALEKLGVWKGAEPKLASAENVRAALVLVARGEAPLGIVYETDAKIEPGVKIVGRFPENSHPPIVYPAAQTVSAKPDAVKFFQFLLSGTALVFFERYGFTYLVKAGP